MSKISYFSSLVIGAGIFQGIFLAVILFGIKKGNSKANKVLAFLLLAFSCTIAHSALFVDVFSSTLSRVLKINEPFQFVLGPLIYLYLRQLTLVESRLKPRDLFHLIPFLLYSLLIMPIHGMLKTEFIPRFLIRHSDTLTTVIWGAILVQLAVYLALSHCEIRQHQQRIKENYSEIDGINLGWLRYFITVILFIYIVYHLLLVMMVHAPNFDHLFPHVQKIIAVVLSLAVYGIGYRGLSQPQIFSFVTPEKPSTKAGLSSPQPMNSLEAPTVKYEHSRLDPKEAEEISQTLLAYMLTEKPYLNPELTLPELADMLVIARNRLSQILNEKLGVSFYDFVNGYRIDQVKEYMAAPEYQHLKMLALAFEAGFNSKATFNNIFKKTVGLTPSEYRKQLTLTSSPSGNNQIYKLN